MKSKENSRIGIKRILALAGLLSYNLYALENRRLRVMIQDFITRIEGGENYSITLRNIFREYHNIEIGMYSYGGCFSSVNIPSGTIIGRYCSFARSIFVLNGSHPILNKSMHPFFYNPMLGYVDELLIRRTKLKIENDVWIGHNAIILPTVNRIENGAVIGGGAVVTKDIPPYAIVAGNPARIIRYRFSSQVIDQLIRTAWWDKNINEIKENCQEFETFLKPLE